MHPLADILKSLADLYQDCAPLSQQHRDEVLSGIHQMWCAEAQKEYCKWRTVKIQDGDEYYFNAVTHETTWEHPAKHCLPGHYMRITAIERLRNQGYVRGLHSRACVACPDCVLKRDVDDDEFEPSEWRLNLDPPDTICFTCDV